MTDMNELEFSKLYYTVADLARATLQHAQSTLIRNLRMFAMANNAIPTVDTSLYCIAYSKEVNDFIVVTNGNVVNPNVVYFSDRKVAIRAIFAYGDDMDFIVEIMDVVGKFGTTRVADEDNSPFSRSELINLYNKLNEFNVDFGE